MSTMLRWLVYCVTGALWASGCIWLVLHYYFQTPTQFGAEPHAWEPPLLLIHGVLAVPALYLFGWISARHSVDGWRMARRRISGSAIFLALLLLATSGFALFFLTADRTRSAFSFVHEILGVACLAPALVHWQRGTRAQQGETSIAAQGHADDALAPVRETTSGVFE